VEQDLARHLFGVRVRAGPDGVLREVPRPGINAGAHVTTPPIALLGLALRSCHRLDRPAQKSSTPMGSSESSSAGASTFGPTPSFSRIFFSISLARSGLSLRKVREFSLPCPSWSPS